MVYALSLSAREIHITINKDTTGPLVAAFKELFKEEPNTDLFVRPYNRPYYFWVMLALISAKYGTQNPQSGRPEPSKGCIFFQGCSFPFWESN